MADHVSENLEWAGLPIEDQLLDHLATPDGATAVWKDGLDPATVDDEGIREALVFVREYMDEHRTPPPLSILAEETGYDEFHEPVAPVAYVVEKLRDRYRRTELRHVVTKIGRLSGTPAEALNYGLQELGRIQLATSSQLGAVSSDDILTTIERYHERLQDSATGISFGYPEMDKALGGLRRGELTFVLGRPKRYKSWQVLKSADAAWDSGLTAAVQTMELYSEDMLDRWVCMRAGISWNKFKHQLLSTEDLRKIAETHEEVASRENKIHFFRPKAGERNVAHLVGLSEDVGADVMYIDQLSWFDGAKDDRAWQKIAQICEEMKDASALFPIYCAAQFNREAANLHEIADLAKIGLSDAIGQYGDTLLGLYASSEMMDQHLLHFGVVESRSFEKAAWEVRVELSDKSNFRILNKLDPSYS